MNFTRFMQPLSMRTMAAFLYICRFKTGFNDGEENEDNMYDL